MNGRNRITSAALGLALALGISGVAAGREPIRERASEEAARAGHRQAGPGQHSHWRYRIHRNVMPYAFGTAPVYVYSYPYVSVYSAPFSPGILHFVEPGQVTVIQPMAWE